MYVSRGKSRRSRRVIIDWRERSVSKNRETRFDRPDTGTRTSSPEHRDLSPPASQVDLHTRTRVSDGPNVAPPRARLKLCASQQTRRLREARASKAQINMPQPSGRDCFIFYFSGTVSNS